MKKFCADWDNEFDQIELPDDRLPKRAVQLLRRFAAEPECPINQVCLNWAETKSAYRFFHNDRISPAALLSPHASKTRDRAQQFDRILAIQDTSYFNYTKHPKTVGLGSIGGREQANLSGLLMHTVFAVTTNGLPLGILDQKIFARAEKKKRRKQSTRRWLSPPQDKESIKWVEGLINSHYGFKNSKCVVITVCDREGDFYELFEHAHILGAHVLIRSKSDRKVRGAYKGVQHNYEKCEKSLKKFMQTRKSRGMVLVEIPSRGGEFGNKARSAELELCYSRVQLLAPVGSAKRRLNKVVVYSIYALERTPPKGEEAIEWMLITDIPVHTFSDAVEKVKWYSFRFRIETLHRILKSGFMTESCRLGTASSLTRYLTLMCIASWRIFWLTVIGRTNPDTPCTLFLTEDEWKILYARAYQTLKFPTHPISTRKAIHLIGRLGGFLDREHDGDPGVNTLWRGWRRLNDIKDGWNIANAA